MATIRAGYDRSGVLSTIGDGPCLVCGCDVEAVAYFTRRMRKASDGAEVKVRVGYQDSCGAVVIDGLYEGSGTTR